MESKRSAFGTMPGGETVELFTLDNERGMVVRATTHGAVITSLIVPDRNGVSHDVVLGYDDLAGYLDPKTPYFGAVVGRYANRIANGTFVLDGKRYALAKNDGRNHLHGGLRGFDKVVWRGEPLSGLDKVGVAFTYLSADGEEGYPGQLTAHVTYELTPANELFIDYRATTTEATPVNLTQHTYFNLAGAGRRNILDHVLTLDADRFLPIDATSIPSGEMRLAADTPFDFRDGRPIGERINATDEQLRFGRGYDHCFVLNKSSDDLTRAACVYEPSSGRVLEILTTEPGIQFYSGNFLDGTIVGKGGRKYEHRYGFCLEPQHFPDSPNRPAFPSTILRPGEEYRTLSVYRFI